MRKLTKKQQLEKENLEWFCPTLFQQYPAKSGDFEEYLAKSERGKKPTVRMFGDYNPYIEAKRWRAITIHELWEASFNDMDWPGYYWLMREEDGTRIPEHIKDYIKKEIFKGKDTEIIDKCYYEK